MPLVTGTGARGEGFGEGGGKGGVGEGGRQASKNIHTHTEICKIKSDRG